MKVKVKVEHLNVDHKNQRGVRKLRMEDPFDLFNFQPGTQDLIPAAGFEPK